jgi:hypothetical protein
VALASMAVAIGFAAYSISAQNVTFSGPITGSSRLAGVGQGYGCFVNLPAGPHPELANTGQFPIFLYSSHNFTAVLRAAPGNGRVYRLVASVSGTDQAGQYEEQLVSGTKDRPVVIPVNAEAFLVDESPSKPPYFFRVWASGKLTLSIDAGRSAGRLDGTFVPSASMSGMGAGTPLHVVGPWSCT